MMPEPVDWSSIHLDADRGGAASRHPNIPTPLVSWKCPGCRAENMGRLEDGCTACGAGKPGYKVEQKPPAVAAAPAVKQADEALKRSFAAWLRATPCPSDVEVVAWAAFQAGAAYAASTFGESVHLLASRQDLGLEAGDVTTRTLVAALRFFIDNILVHAPEEVKLGEWHTAEGAEQLITDLLRKEPA